MGLSAGQPRILVYAPFSFTGRGPAESCAEILSAFSPRDQVVDLFACRFRRKLPSHIRVHSSLPVFLRSAPWRYVEGPALRILDKKFRRALDTADPRSTVAHFWPDPPVDLVNHAVSLGITTVREMINCACATSGPILDAAYRAANLSPSHLVTTEKIARETTELGQYDYFFASNPEVEKSLTALGVPRARILATSFGWSPARVDRYDSARRIEDGKTRFLFIGSLSVRKGVPELLRAWRDAAIDGELVLAGQSDPELASVVSRLSTASVQVLGFVSDIGALLSSADVFIFPTHEEGGPQVTYEAAGAGLPIITTPMGAARLVNDGSSGLIVPAGSISDLVSSIRLLHEQPDLRRTYGHAAKEASARFTYDMVGLGRAEQLRRLLAFR